MAELPIPDFSTFEKLYGWATEQAEIFCRVIQSPANFYIETVSKLPNPASELVKFLAFVVLATIVVEIPVDAVMWNIRIFDAAVFISDFLPSLIDILLFTFSIFWFAKLLRGKGEFRQSVAGLFFSSAFVPFIYATQYLTRLDPAYRAFLLDYPFDLTKLPPVTPLTFVGSLLETAVFIWVIVKLVPLVRVFIHLVGSFRALLIVGFAGLTEQAFVMFVWVPFWAALVKMAAKQ